MNRGLTEVKLLDLVDVEKFNFHIHPQTQHKYILKILAIRLYCYRSSRCSNYTIDDLANATEDVTWRDFAADHVQIQYKEDSHDHHLIEIIMKPFSVFGFLLLTASLSVALFNSDWKDFPYYAYCQINHKITGEDDQVMLSAQNLKDLTAFGQPVMPSDSDPQEKAGLWTTRWLVKYQGKNGPERRNIYMVYRWKPGGFLDNWKHYLYTRSDYVSSAAIT